MGAQHNVLAVVFDFDDTLIGDSTSKLLAAHGIDPENWWQSEIPPLVKAGFDPTLAWLNLLLETVGDGRPLGFLTNAALSEFGTTLDGDFAPGIPEVFDDLRQITDQYRDVAIEFYVISGGLEAVIRGSRIMSAYMTDVYGCLLGEHPETGLVSRIRRCITFTEKTRYLFEINKGLSSADTAENPYLVNEDVAPSKRRIPFRNMIYVGDGFTDVPCFSLLKAQGGLGFGVFDPSEEKSRKRGFLKLLQPQRVISLHAAKYRDDDELGALLRTAVATRCSEIQLERGRA